jgi:hypothetical protein
MQSLFINDVAPKLGSPGNQLSQMGKFSRVFERACDDLRIPIFETAYRDTLATVILATAKHEDDETTIFINSMLAMKSRY